MTEASKSLDFCFIGPKFDEQFDRKLFEDNDELIQIQPLWTTMAHLVAHVGIFKSVSEAKKNGWDKPIPSGWSEWKFPKRFFGRGLFVWNPLHTQKEWDELYE